jgi:Domain of unknown function (DUF4835)
MILKKYCQIFILACVSTMTLNAQELNFQVKVSNPRVQLADPKLFQSMEAALKELVNNTKWTEDVFELNERLEGSIQLTIKEERGTNLFMGQLSITASRPIYGTDQQTPILIHLDQEVVFGYEQFQPLQFAQNTFSDNLTATIAYYVYVILGYDYDSFSPSGGEVHWQKAQDIFTTVPAATKKEWQGSELGNQNRYWFVENVLSPRLKNFRLGLYEYHRLGLDNAQKDMNLCKNAIMQCLEHIEEAQQTYPNTRAVRTFAATKTDELINIFKNASTEQKARFIKIMSRLDPANSSKFNEVGF